MGKGKAEAERPAPEGKDTSRPPVSRSGRSRSFFERRGATEGLKPPSAPSEESDESIMNPLDVLWNHLGLVVFTVLTGVIVAYLIYAIVHPERF